MKWKGSESEENSDNASKKDLDNAEAMLAIEKDINKMKWR